MTLLADPLARVAREARPYPAHLLPPRGTALALFSAAYLGHNDVIHMARRNMVATCVDIDRGRLGEMESLYPETWAFVCADAWEFAEEAAARGASWDAVSVDSYTGDATDRSVASLELWCSLARAVVTATVTPAHTDLMIPDSWRPSIYPRTDRVDWLVLTHA